jgi:hypothetical protein
MQVSDNVTLVKMDKEYAGNTGKHRDLAKVIPTMKDWQPNDWVIFTDVHDVVFQAPIPKLPNLTLLTSCEGKKFGEIDFWRDRMPAEYHSWTAYNVGTFAIRYELLLQFWKKLDASWMDFYSWYKHGHARLHEPGGFPFNTNHLETEYKEISATIFNGYFDTIIFNKFIRRKTVKAKAAPWLFGCYAYEQITGGVTMKDSKMYRDNQLIPITHYNGCSKGMMPQFVGL